MKNILLAVCGALLFLSCHNKTIHGKFTVTGDIKNVPDQKIYLVQIYFNERNPEVLDTDEIKDGHFVLSGIAPEEGMFQLQLEDHNTDFPFINDKPDIDFTADLSTPSLQSVFFNTPANDLLKNLFTTIDAQRSLIVASDSNLEKLENKYISDTSKVADSILTASETANDNLNNGFKKYLSNYIDTSSDPMVALYTLGSLLTLYPDINYADLDKSVNNLPARFSKNDAVDAMVTQFNQGLAQYKSTPHIGDMAPNIDMPDTTGNAVNLNAFRGQYVLVDFWASWCEYCRIENPNVVKVYNQYKDDDFTVLGVSLDKEKHPWEEAINADKLNWHQVSDLQGWGSQAVGLYGFNGIPYNVLIDPAGRIVGTNLTGYKLERKLYKLLK